MIIYLIGFMGVGKSTLGKKLASRLQLHFVDLDKEIATSEGQSIEAIFQQKGEPYFRELEIRELRKEERNNSVIAVGGGTPCFGDNLSYMKSRGTVVYLQADAGLLCQRLLVSKSERPLIQQFKNDPEKLREFIDKKLEERRPFYEASDITVSVKEMNATEIDKLIQTLKLLSKS
ncbi:MAG: shikimate kinase [Crocinitomicaceae bacterium]